MQWPLIALEQCHPMPQAFASGVFVQPVELAFMGVYPTHEPVSRRFRRRFEVGMVATVQHQFVAALHARASSTRRNSGCWSRGCAMEIRYHQPGDRHPTDGIHRLDEGTVVGPGFCRDVVQHQGQGALSYNTATGSSAVPSTAW